MATINGTLIVIATVLIASVTAFDYCQIKSCLKREHTMCKFSSQKWSPACYKLKSNFLTSTEKDEIVKIHNMFRSKVSKGKEHRGNPGPQPAGKINPLKWDNELAEIAQKWANQCTETHDTCRNTKNFVYVGQNWSRKGNSRGWTANMTSLITGWYEEVKNFNKNNVKKFIPQKGSVTGHYTQMIWGATTHIGCGLTRFYDRKFYNTLLVCNYGPGGNIYETPVYHRI